jgi:predicted RNA-binding protein (virulence factor B family)
MNNRSPKGVEKMKRKINTDNVEIIRTKSRTPVSKVTHISADTPKSDFYEGQKVTLLIGEETEIGYKAIIKNCEEGILYKNEVFQPLEKGQKVEGFIKKIREDKRIDLSLYKPGYKKVDALSERIIERLKEAGGFLPVTDKSQPDTIAELFGVSKKTYKMIIGGLYKKKMIAIEDDGIRLIKKGAPAFVLPGMTLARQAGSRHKARDKKILIKPPVKP